MTALSFIFFDLRKVVLTKKNAHMLFKNQLYMLTILTTIWIVTQLAFKNEYLKIGFFWSALSPIALFAPGLIFSAKNQEEKYNQSYFNLFWGMLFSPILYPTLTWIFFGKSFVNNYEAYFKDVVVAVYFPLAFVFILQATKLNLLLRTYLTKNRINKLNIGFVAILTYIFLGTSMLKINFSTLPHSELILCFMLGLFFNPILFLISRLIAQVSNTDSENRAYESIGHVFKNVALAASLLNFYYPQAILPMAVILLSHAFSLMLMPYIKRIFLL